LSVTGRNCVEIAGEAFILGCIGVRVGHLERSKCLLSSFVGYFVLPDSFVSSNMNQLNCGNLECMGVCKAKARVMPFSSLR